MRNLNKTLAMVSLLAPASAHPLGVGEIKLHSALNQQLNAEIPLIVSKSENPANIRVNLAAPEKFDEAGVPWSYFLSKIKFKTQVRADGSVVVKLTSNEALREPFLDFLLEVTWDKGNLYREFTVLVDPPSSYSQPVIPVANPATTPVSTSVAQQSSQTTQAAVIQVEDELSSGRYGPTRRSDTLWDIAARLRPRKDISIEQMMIALYEANPQAFYKPNVNALMAGEKLKVPEIDSILKISRKQAARIFHQQYQDWINKKTAVAKTSTTTSSSNVTAKTGQQLELVAPAESTVDASAQIAAAQQETTENIASPAQDNNVEALPEGADNKALLVRLEKLEQQLSIMQKMLAVKDAQLALLQNKEHSGLARKDVVGSSSAKSQAEPSVSEQKTERVPVKKVPTTAKKPIKPVRQPAPPVQAAEPESSFFADFYYAIVGGASVLILSLLAWLWLRKRRAEQEADNDSMFAASSQIIMPDSEISDEVGQKSAFDEENQSAYDVGTVGESSFLSEFTPSDFDAFDADQNEVDPIAEADVYLAYGRFQQAEELMRQAIDEHPDRQECKLKLLEIFYASENKDGFEAYMNELAASPLKEDADFWGKVEEMQKELGLEASSTIASDAASMEASGVQTQTAEAEDDVVEETTEHAIDGHDETGNSAQSESEEDAVLDLSSLDDLDFDLNGFNEKTSGTGESEKTADTEDIETLDFDLDFASGTMEAKPEPVTDSKSDAELETFDFHTEESETKTEKPELVEESKAAAEESFDFDFNFEESSFNVAPETETESAESEVSDLTDMDEFETKLDLARAYIDMGDSEAAKNAAEEVLENGNDQQKQSARKILDSL